MDVKFEKYLIEPEYGRYNLYFLYKAKNKQGKLYERKKSMGYGMNFEHCLDAIIHDKMKLKEGVTSIPEWIKQYKEIALIVLNILKP